MSGLKVGSTPFVSSTWNMVNHNVPRNAWLREGNSKGELMRVVAEESGKSRPFRNGGDSG